MTVVKIQRPIFTDTISGKVPWLIYDKFRARECILYEVPISVLNVFDSAPKQTSEHFKQYFDDAEWDEIKECWDLSNVKPITRRLIW